MKELSNPITKIEHYEYIGRISDSKILYKKDNNNYYVTHRGSLKRITAKLGRSLELDFRKGN